MQSELLRELGEGLRIAIGAVQVPTFVGEGSVLAVELERPLARAEVERILTERSEILLGESPSLRDALGRPVIRMGPVEVDTSGAPG